MTLWKTTALALVLAAAPASAFACSWMREKSATLPTPVTIGSSTAPAGTTVDVDAITPPVIEVERKDADAATPATPAN